MEIRKLLRDDWQILKRLLIDSSLDCPEAFAEAPYQDQAFEGADIFYQDFAKKWSQQREVVYYLIDDNGEPCGMLLGSIDGFIGRLWVCGRLRKKGYAQKLVDEYYLPWLRERRAGGYVTLFVNEEMSAVDFYSKLRFEKTGEKMEVQKGEKTIIMIEMKRSFP